MSRSILLIALLLTAMVGGCNDFPGRRPLCQHDHGGSNRGGALQGLPVTPYTPR
jgi:hypothetical protein